MSIVSLCIIAVTLAFDAFAVSISAGMSSKAISQKNALMLAGSFGFFQALMPLIGWFGGKAVEGWVRPFDHWIIFGILSFLGGKMIMEGLSHDTEEKKDYFSLQSIFLLSIATSIDALAAGISFSLMNVDIFFAVAIIGLITMVLCYIGVVLAKKFSENIGSRAEIFGGIILICIGLKILIEHVFFS